MPLITRNTPRLTLEGARAVLTAAERRAAEIQRPMNIAVVDDGGQLLAFIRMDESKPASIAIAITKARAAALRRSPTGPPSSSSEGTASLMLGLGLAAARSDQQTPIRGGIPLVADGQVVGAIGVSAGNQDEDVTVAEAGALAGA